MTHLSETELLDAVDGRLAADRQRHAVECADCAQQLDDLRAVLARAREMDVPEPSPLFWDHLSARVRKDIAHETPSRWARWALPSSLRPWPAAAAAAVAAVTLVVTISVLRSSPNGPTPDPERQRAAETQSAMANPPHSDPLTDDIEVDEAWAVVREVADEVVWDDETEAAISPRPGSMERAVQTLTAAERVELAALIAEELKRSGA
jgi:hypothetical protein